MSFQACPDHPRLVRGTVGKKDLDARGIPGLNPRTDVIVVPRPCGGVSRHRCTLRPLRFFLDKANSDLLRIEITSIDHALTRPWTVLKTFRRERKFLWAEYDCAESNNHVMVGKEYYFLSGDGYLMPTRKDQPPPDPRYFKTAK